MSKSTITEKALADSLKQLMHRHPINKIHIQMIVDNCDLTRHTFYNHFQDVYELLGWIYEHDVIQDLEFYCNLTQWKEGILLILNYTVENRAICLNAYHSLGRDHLEAFIYKVFRHILEGILADITQNMQVNEQLKEDTIRFYTNAIMGIFIAWLKQDLRDDPAYIADWIERMTKGNLVRLMDQYAKL